MKANIHPVYYPNAVVTCACGSTFTTGSTKKTIAVDVCSACHPFFTGQMKFVDTQGRVERFQAKMKAGKITKKSRRTESAPTEQRSLKEMLTTAKKKAKS